jgi:hypothetical protein
MKSVVAIVLGLVIAFAIACGGAAKPAYRETAPPPRDGGLGVAPRAEIDQLDAAITADMEKLAAPRPDPAPGACVENCEPRAMAGAATTTAAEDPSCRPGGSATCTEACTLKGSICKNATRICEIAAQLGGTDAYANDKCNRGTASCAAAKQRCCNCT